MLRALNYAYGSAETRWEEYSPTQPEAQDAVDRWLEAYPSLVAYLAEENE